MKSRLIWLAVVVAAMAGFYYTTIRPALNPAPASMNRRINKEFRPLDIPPPPLPTPQIEMPSIPLPPPEMFRIQPPAPAPVAPRRDDRQPMRMEVPIQDGATIDFSIGAPVVRSQGADKAALDKAIREMAEATKDTTFPPSPSPEKK